jgi:hypothetical protein
LADRSRSYMRVLFLAPPRDSGRATPDADRNVLSSEARTTEPNFEGGAACELKLETLRTPPTPRVLTLVTASAFPWTTPGNDERQISPRRCCQAMFPQP